ncbi:Renal dipeptidase [Alteribacter lacisalsi]|uniref:Renal dipeptidase n=1 Tax=Alteribacter lacisalsi TaxID=2045244 RepID=A0A2W0HTP1_9BACI|nr:nucleotidyltransferase family protein [Alteribacter lacisalsi]PYZ96968.1 Renal dipeptidase [Alteribacter lacisalsi]
MAEQNTLNIKNVPLELKLLMELVRQEPRIERLEQMNAEGIDWSHFTELVYHHRLHPLMNSKLKHHVFIPAQVKEQFAFEYKRNMFLMLQLSAEMERVNSVFQKQEIPLLFLKGPVLAKLLYGDVSLRTSSDLDFLVPMKDLEQAETLLQEMGYVKDDYIDTILGDWKWRHHHVTYYHPVKRTKLEIHWRLHPGPGKEPGFKELWQRKNVSTVTGRPVYYLGKEDLFYFLTSHGARHGWSRLRWLLDIHHLVQLDLNWNKAASLMRKFHRTPTGGQALVLSENLFGSELPHAVRKHWYSRRAERLAQDAVFYLENLINLHNEPLPEHISEHHKQHLFSLMSKPQKVLFILSFLYPYPEDAELLPLPSGLHWLYFPLRPVLWVWRKTRKHELT